jgi:hypothetical protein
LWFEASLGKKKFMRPPSEPMPGYSDSRHHPSHMESTKKRITVPASPGIKGDPSSKIKNAKRDGRVVQVAEHLPSKCGLLTSTPSTAQKRPGQTLTSPGEVEKLTNLETMPGENNTTT